MSDPKALVDDHLYMVEIVTKEYLSRAPLRGYLSHLDDLYCYGCIALVEASHRFDPSRGFLFATYASNHIRHRLRKEIIKIAKERQVEVSLDTQVFGDSLSISTPDFALTLGEERDEGLDVVAFLEPEDDELELEVYHSHLLGGEGIKSLSKRLHRSHHTIRKVKAKLLKEFKIKLEREL